jgi:tetratricopeptide (TPR) repeat protein
LTATRRDRPAAPLDPDTLAALEEQRAFLLRSLEDLDREHAAGDLDDDDYVALRDDYTARAAAVLRAIEGHRAASGSARPPRSRARTLAVLAAVVALSAVAGVLLARASGSRPPGEQATGGIAESSRDLLLRARDLTGQAQAALQAGDGNAAVEAYKGAIDAYDAALELQPANVEAMTYRGWLLHNLALQSPTPDAAAELDSAALEWLDRAVDTDPAYPDARVFRALLHERLGRTQAALADIRAVDEGALPPGMGSMVATVRQRLEAAAGAGAQADVPPAAAPGPGEAGEAPG